MKKQQPLSCSEKMSHPSWQNSPPDKNKSCRFVTFCHGNADENGQKFSLQSIFSQIITRA